MGLLRAALIVGVIYSLWQILEAKFLFNVPLEVRAKWVPYLPLAITFVIEVLL